MKYYQYRLSNDPNRFAEITKKWAAETNSELANTFDHKALGLGELSNTDYLKAHREIFGEKV